VLPAAGWGEKDGTFINSERRISRVRKVARAPGRRWRTSTSSGCSPTPGGAATSSRVADPRGRVRPAAGALPRPALRLLRHRGLRRARGGRRRPVAQAGAGPVATSGDCSPTAGSRTPTGARASSSTSHAPRRGAGDARPLVLLTGRGSTSEWHTGTRTSKAPACGAAPRDPYVEVSPGRRGRRGIDAPRWVEVRLRARVDAGPGVVTPTIREGQVFLSMHHATTNRSRCRASTRTPGSPPTSTPPSRCSGSTIRPERGHAVRRPRPRPAARAWTARRPRRRPGDGRGRRPRPAGRAGSHG
jgi:predicted molibdopterin-dependent oxidoreductase YjgC